MAPTEQSTPFIVMTALVAVIHVLRSSEDMDRPDKPGDDGRNKADEAIHRFRHWIARALCGRDDDEVLTK